MPKVSVNILTKNRADLLRRALQSVAGQSFKDFEIIIINDGSTDETQQVLEGYKDTRIQIINHTESKGITISRQEALEASRGEYVAILDDDDEWLDTEKLAKQVKFLDEHPQFILAGGAIQISNIKYQISKLRPETDKQIRRTMLFRNNFFTSTVMFRKEAAVKAGGFLKDIDDFGEDYDLWLRMGKMGKMSNFQEVFAEYRVPNYNKTIFMAFLAKQARLINREKSNYPFYWLATVLLKFRLFLDLRIWPSLRQI